MRVFRSGRKILGHDLGPKMGLYPQQVAKVRRKWTMEFAYTTPPDQGSRILTGSAAAPLEHLILSYQYFVGLLV